MAKMLLSKKQTTVGENVNHSTEKKDFHNTAVLAGDLLLLSVPSTMRTFLLDIIYSILSSSKSL